MTTTSYAFGLALSGMWSFLGAPDHVQTAFWFAPPVAQVQCDQGDQWSVAPEIVELLNPGQTETETTFRGTLVTTCTISGTRGGGIPAYDSYLTRNALRGATVHSGPNRNQFLGLPSIHYDATMSYDHNGNTIINRSDIQIASNQDSRFVFSTLSSLIQAGGWDKYLRKFDAQYEITKTDSSGFRMRLVNSLRVAKPWGVPGGLFRDHVAEQAQEEMVEYRTVLMRTLGQFL